MLTLRAGAEAHETESEEMATALIQRKRCYRQPRIQTNNVDMTTIALIRTIPLPSASG